MGLSALSAGVSSLSASQQALAGSAHNIANASTQGFRPQQVSFQENKPAGTGVSLSSRAQTLSAAAPVAAPSQTVSGTDLAKEISDALLYKAQFDLSAKVVKTSDETLGSLINTKA